MSRFLRQSTASQDRLTAMFVDDTDFKTPETALTIANTDVKLSKNGAASANKNSGGGTHRTTGRYSLTFDATDTDTVGELAVAINIAGALPVEITYRVLEEAVYDALFAASAPGYGTAQTGDSYAKVNDGTFGLAAIKGFVDDIGVAGAGLTAVPWNAAWDAEVQSEVADALDAAVPGSPTANSLNERIKTMDDADIPGRLPAALSAGGFMKGDLQTWLTVAPLALNSQRPQTYVAAMATGVVDAAALAADAVDEIWDEVQEGTLTARHMMRIFMSALAGILAGAATTAVTTRDVANAKDRITATVDANGNRSAVSVDGT